MRTPLRLRMFYWLIGLLALFVAMQFVIYTIIELRAWRHHPNETLREHTQEVVQGVGWDLVILPILVAAAWWISRRMIDPIRAVTDAAERIRSGRFDERIATEEMADDEMRRMSRMLNAAFDNYHEAVDRLRRFSGDASHQLRTPLAAMRSVGEVALSRERSPEEYRQVVVSMLEEVQRMTRVTEQLLRLARLERTEVRSSFVPLDVAAVIHRVASLFQPLCDEKEVRLDVPLARELWTIGSEDLLVEMLANLLDNALRVTPKGGAIRILAEQVADGGIAVEVADTGPGIDPELSERIFELFAQVPGTRQTGAGLGLAIVAAIAAVHGGSARLDKHHRGGASFKVLLPGRDH